MRVWALLGNAVPELCLTGRTYSLRVLVCATIEAVLFTVVELPVGGLNGVGVAFPISWADVLLLTRYFFILFLNF